jgi:hypothetical protein
MKMKIQYRWSMPDKQTFNMKPVREFILKEIVKHNQILIPFAGWTRFRFKPQIKITYIDIKPDLPKPYFLGDCIDIMKNLIKQGKKYSLILSDPPFSMYQAVHTYNNKKMQDITHIRNLYNQLLLVGGIIISCGYNTTGMSTKRGFEKTELLIVNCGGSHNDFLILKEKQIQRRLI